MKSVVIMGLGYIGLPYSISLANAGIPVKGFDVNPVVLTKLRSGLIHIVEPDLQAAFDVAKKTGMLTFIDAPEAADIFIITVPTPFYMEDGRPTAGLQYVKSAAEMVGKVLQKGNLVILESTSPPRTTEMMGDILSQVSGLDKNDFYTAHCPERVIPGNMLHELRTNDRIIGSKSSAGAEIARELYAQVVTDGKIFLTDDITAEMCKLAENTYRDVNIAYANELSIIADNMKIDVFELIRLANRHPRVNILSPGVGVGGHCVAVDPWFLVECCEKDAKIIRAARDRNDSKPFWVADKVEGMIGHDTSKIIAILGMSFKADVDDMRESASRLLGRELIRRGYQVVACEPFVNKPEIDGIKNLSLEMAIDTCDFSVITLGHRYFKEGRELIRRKPYFDCMGLMN